MEPDRRGIGGIPRWTRVIARRWVRARALSPTLVAAVALALAACGTHAAPEPKPPVSVSNAPQLVSMRRINGATWQTVIIRTDGTGDVGIFIGERAGTHHRAFRLSPGELERLRRLIALTARIRRTPDFGSTPSIEYIIFAQGHVFETANGHVPRRLAGLTGVLSGLIDQYA